MSVNNSSNNSNNGSAWKIPPGWRPRWKTLLLIYLDIKLVMYMVLQSQYEMLQTRFRKMSLQRGDGSGHQQESLLIRLQNHRQLMRDSGAVFRDLGPVIMLGYGLFLFNHLVYYYSNWLFRTKQAKYCHNDDFIQVHLNPQRADAKLESTFDRYLGNMMKATSKKFVQINHQQGWSSERRHSRLVADLGDHATRLNKLLRDKSTIWPANRSSNWKKEQSKYVLRSYVLTGLPIHALGGVVIFSTVHYVSNPLKQRGETPINLLERLAIFEDFLSFFLSMELFVPQMILLLANLREKNMLLATIEQRFRRLNCSLVELKQRKQPAAATWAVRNTSRTPQASNSDSSINLVQQLQSKCNREALEIYLSLRVFIDQLRTTTGMASLFISQSTLLSAAMLLITLFHFDEADSDQLSFIAVITLIFGSVMNAVFVLSAEFQSNCNKTTQLVWSLLANITLEQPAAFNSEKQPELDHHPPLGPPGSRSLVRNQLGYSRIPLYDLYGANNEVNIHEHELKSNGCLINMDTAELWRRFAGDLGIICEQISCKVFGAIKMNYGEVLNLNFWFLSVALVVLTQKS